MVLGYSTHRVCTVIVLEFEVENLKKIKKTMIKVCGLTDKREASYLNACDVEFAGFVLFFPKSKRNISIEKAEKIMAELDENIKKVAVVVSPDKEQVAFINDSQFDFIQIHGKIKDDVLEGVKLPILKAFNVDNIADFERYRKEDKIAGYVFDAAEPGSGKAFDWDILGEIERDKKMFILAGGLNQANVKNAVEFVKPDVVDVSSGVEKDSGLGKDKKKIEKFVAQVRDDF